MKPIKHEWREGELPADERDFLPEALLTALYIVIVILAIIGN